LADQQKGGAAAYHKIPEEKKHSNRPEGFQTPPKSASSYA